MSNDGRPPTHPSQPARERGDLESTVDLIERARHGDQDAIEQLFERHRRPLQRWASGRLPSWARALADTDDLVQDTLLQTFKRIGEFQPRRVGALQAYLRQAVVNRIRDELRRRGRQAPTAELDGLELDQAPSPLEEAIGQEALERYQEALQRLRPEEREAVVGRVEMNYTYDELALVLGKPTSEAARKAARRALVRLAEELKGGRSKPAR